MITKEYIMALKFNSDNAITSLVSSQKDTKNINFILKNLGRLPENFDPSFLYELLHHKQAKIRLNAVKNIGKLNGKTDIGSLLELYKKETDSSVKREIVSSIGRQRKIQNKNILLKFLEDDDPKIICQAIRGLLVFENDKNIESHLHQFINHPNEMVRTIIYKEYFSKEAKKTNLFVAYGDL